MTWMEEQDMINKTEILRIKIKAGSVFLKSSTAHHHPDEFFIVNAAIGVFMSR